MVPSAGYSGTPLPKKLGIAEGTRVALVHAPAGVEGLLVPLPAGAVLRRGLGRGGVDIVVVFVTDRARLEGELDRLTAALPSDGALWVAWPKRASGVATDMTEHVVRELALPRGWVDVKVCAIDATWTGFKLVLRKELRPARVDGRGAAAGRKG